MMPLASCRRLLRRWNAAGVGLLIAAGLLCLVACPADLCAADPRAATTSREAEREAIAALPLAQLAAQDRATVRSVVENHSVYRRLPTSVVQCDPHLFSFLLDHPEVLTNIWQLMRISDVHLQRTSADTFRADDGQGTVADIKVLYRGHDTQLLYAEGAYSGPLLTQPIRGRCLLLLRFQGIEETNGRHYVTCRLDTFLHMERVGIDMLAKAFHPLVGRSADANFTETLAFVGHLSQTCTANPSGTARLAQMLTHVEPTTRTRFGEVVQAAAHRTAGVASPPLLPREHAAMARKPSRQPVQVRDE